MPAPASRIPSGPTLRLLRGAQILVGTDVWYRADKKTARVVVASAVFSRNEMQQIVRSNALRLPPGLATLETRKTWLCN